MNHLPGLVVTLWCAAARGWSPFAATGPIYSSNSLVCVLSMTSYVWHYISYIAALALSITGWTIRHVMLTRKFTSAICIFYTYCPCQKQLHLQYEYCVRLAKKFILHICSETGRRRRAFSRWGSRVVEDHSWSSFWSSNKQHYLSRSLWRKRRPNIAAGPSGRNMHWW